ncbi:hypothetical protein NF188_001060 [Salmonella enterica]|nr:hypothetical protein [Salmonella enterica]
MEIRSVLVLRFAKEIDFSGKRGVSPVDYEKKLLAYARDNGCVYGGFIGEWEGNRTKVLMICKHGHKFVLTVNKILIGRGCQECSKEAKRIKNKRPEHEALAEAREIAIRRNRGEVVVGFDGGYAGRNVKNLIVICPVHGEYKISLDYFARNQGCRKCGVISSANARRKSIDDALTEARNIALERGKGEKVVGFDNGYHTVNQRNLIIICPIHGEYRTSLADFADGKGCSVCAKYGFQKDKPGYFYIQKLSGCGVDAFKFGITNRNVDTRVHEQSRSSKIDHELIFFHHFGYGKQAMYIEKLVKEKFKNVSGVVSKEAMPDGYTETISLEYLPVVLSNVKSMCLNLS